LPPRWSHELNLPGAAKIAAIAWLTIAVALTDAFNFHHALAALITRCGLAAATPDRTWTGVRRGRTTHLTALLTQLAHFAQ
jgi:hypothetical protein